MEVLILILTCLSMAVSIKQETELKIDYYQKLIDNAFQQVETYKIRQNNSDYSQNVNSEAEVIDYGTFDFIVVGSGSSGSVVASRLSEVEEFKVLLLEAGDWDDDLTDIPYISELLQFSDRNWGYFSTPQKHGCYGSKDRRCVYSRGKVVGGSGTINGLDYFRGNKGDYDNWAALGNSEWSFENILPYFKKMENFESKTADLNYRGFGGPVNVAYKEPKENFTIISQAFSKVGIKTIDDYNGKQQIGVSRVQRNIKNGKRVSGATVYVRPASSRPNFNVTVNAFVTKILIDQLSKTATGVEFVKGGKTFRAITSKEVILSAGTINTAQILMLSGIGPEKHLQDLGIPVLANLPVGQYTKDHYGFLLKFKTSYEKTTKPFREYIKDYVNGEGILTNFRNQISISYINTRNASSSVPNIQFSVFLPSPVQKEVPSVENLTPEAEEDEKKFNSHEDLGISIFLPHPKSPVSIKLQSRSPVDFPLIDIGMFTDPDDIALFYEGIQIVKKIAAEINGTKEIKYEPCNMHVYESKEYYFCVLRHMAFGGYHISTSAKMGPKDDPSAVVDQNLRIYGVNGLRVADCSIMPTTISGHTNPVAFMIGEKAADIIKKYHQA